MYSLNSFLFGVVIGIIAMLVLSITSEYIQKQQPVILQPEQTVQCVVELYPKLNRKEIVRYYGTVRKQI